MRVLLTIACFVFMPLGFVGACLMFPFEVCFDRLNTLERLQNMKPTHCHTGEHLLSGCPGDHGK